MPGSFIDTNVLVYLATDDPRAAFGAPHHGRDPRHRAGARRTLRPVDLRRDDRGVRTPRRVRHALVGGHAARLAGSGSASYCDPVPSRLTIWHPILLALWSNRVALWVVDE